MNSILFLFIFPIATIIFSIALQLILKKPFLVSAIILAIFLIVTFTVYGVNFLIAAFIYAIIALITAYIVSLFCKIGNRTIQINLINNNRNSCCNTNWSNGQCLISDENLRLLNNPNLLTGNAESEGDPDTTACRTCACQRQFRNCLRNVQDRSGNNGCNCGNDDLDTTACRTCACQRQFRNCLRRV